MPALDAEIFDLALTQALERYLELPVAEAGRLVRAEWPEQAAAVLYSFLFNNSCRHCDHSVRFVHITRKNGTSSLILPLCCRDTVPHERLGSLL